MQRSPLLETGFIDGLPVTPANEDILNCTFSRHQDVVPRVVAGETILVPVRGELAHMKQIFVLNPVAEFVWQNLNGSKAVESVLAGVVEEFDIDESTARSDVLEFLAELEEAGLITGTTDQLLREE